MFLAWQRFAVVVVSLPGVIEVFRTTAANAFIMKSARKQRLDSVAKQKVSLPPRCGEGA